MEIETKEKNKSGGDKKFYSIKIIVVGNSTVGKTKIIYRLVNNEFIDDRIETIGRDFETYNVEYNDKILKLLIMDTAGSERFRSVTRGYFKNCSFALIVYDITNQESFNSIKEWIEDCQNYANDNIHMVLVGNKIDKEEERKISKEQGKELAKEHIMDFYETSAKTGENIEDIFLGLCELISNNIDEGKYDFNNPSSGVSEIPIGDELLKVNKTFSLSEKNNYSVKYGIQIKKKNKCCK